MAAIWHCHVPVKVKIFGWLLYCDRLNTRRNLKKHIITEDACPRCNHAPETNDHLFFQCQSSRAVWNQLGLSFPSSHTAPWTSNPPDAAVPTLLWPAMVFTILWKIWDSRNSIVFRRISLPPNVTIRNILEDFTLWSHRLRNADSKIAAIIWCNYLSQNREIFS